MARRKLIVVSNRGPVTYARRGGERIARRGGGDLASAPSVDHGTHHAWEEGYVAVNRAFADAVVSELDREPEASVFFHDYHLYLAPRFVRDARPDVALAQFVHIPWPEPNAWRVLPEPIRWAVH